VRERSRLAVSHKYVVAQLFNHQFGVADDLYAAVRGFCYLMDISFDLNTPLHSV